MIVPMKKLSLVVMERDSDSFLKKLREIGVVHPQRKRVPSAYLARLLGQQDLNRKAINVLQRYMKNDANPPPLKSIVSADTNMTNHILGLVDEKEVLQKQLAYLEKEKRRVEPWGDFEPHDFSFLSHQGVELYLYLVSLFALKRIGDEIKIIVISRDKQWAKVLAIGNEIPGITPFRLPTHSLSYMENRINSIRTHIEGIENELVNIAYHREQIEADMSHVSDEIEFEMARAGMGTLAEESIEIEIAWLSGFVPDEKVEIVINAARENGWTLAWDDPAPADRPPTLLRNRPFVRIIEPLFSMLGTIPGYWEYDISLSYMVFLCVFFAMIFGDAGYGFFLLGIGGIIGLVSKNKSIVKPGEKKKIPDAARLIMLLSSCAP